MPTIQAGHPAVLPVIGRPVRVEKALRAIAALEGTSATNPRKLMSIAGEPGSSKFLSLILTELRDGGITATTRGVAGGYWLTRPLEEITLLQVFEALAPGPPIEAEDPRGGALWAVLEARVRALLTDLTVADHLAGRLG